MLYTPPLQVKYPYRFLDYFTMYLTSFLKHLEIYTSVTADEIIKSYCWPWPNPLHYLMMKQRLSYLQKHHWKLSRRLRERERETASSEDDPQSVFSSSHEQSTMAINKVQKGPSTSLELYEVFGWWCFLVGSSFFSIFCLFVCLFLKSQLLP